MALEFLDPTLTPYAAAFLLVFAIVFGLLSVAKHEKRDKQGNVVESTPLFDRKVNAIIALAFGLFSVLYEPFVTGLQTFLPLATIFLLIVFFIIFLKRVFGGGKEGEKSDTLPIAVTLAVLLIVMTALGDQIVAMLPINIESTTLLWLSGLLIIILLFYAVYSRPEKK
jgi:preprotein translocase subunit SecG